MTIIGKYHYFSGFIFYAYHITNGLIISQPLCNFPFLGKQRI